MRKRIWVVLSGVCFLALAACVPAGPSQAAVSPLPPTQAAVITSAPSLAPSATWMPTPQPATATATAFPTHTVSPTPAAPSATPTVVNRTPLPAAVSGVVVDGNVPVAGAVVQLHGLPKQVTADAKGAFRIDGLGGTAPMTITAWSAGYYVGWVVLNPSAPNWKGPDAVTISLKPVPQKDNTQYPWFSFNGVLGSASCGLCHREYKEWQADAHSQSAKNLRFLTLYTGANVKGQPGPATKWGSNGSALPPDPNQPYYGPGFRLDTPERAGNCATCHTPVASKVPNDVNCAWGGCHTDLTIERSRGVIQPATRPIVSSGDGAEGITCDFCHKIASVIIDPKTGLPKPDMPGILSMQLTRPEEGQQIFYGTLIDVPRRDTYLPLLNQSAYCAPCHYGVFGGVVGVGEVTGGVTIYNSFGEWLNSPYSDPKTGKTCQQCHMPVSPANWYVFPEQGGLTRDYAQLHNHTMPGAADEQLLQNAVSLSSTARHNGSQLQVDVQVTNDQTGHDVPTDAPTRSMILVVEALDANGKPLQLSQGPVNPAWSGNLGGKPGKTFAKVLKDLWTGETPTAAYWRPVEIVEDNRLKAMAADHTRYIFDLPAGQAAKVNIRLVYRRTFQKLAEQKGFTDPDILMEENRIQVDR